MILSRDQRPLETLRREVGVGYTPVPLSLSEGGGEGSFLTAAD